MPFDSVQPALEVSSSRRARFVRFILMSWDRMLRRRGISTLHYLTKAEAHTFAFSVAANAILSFFPFMVLMMWLIHNVFHSQNMADVVVMLLRDHLPAGQDFIIKNLNYLVTSKKGVKLASLVILLVTSTGVFLPLEVALNQIWGFTKNRSYLGNQLISLVLAFACGILAMASIGAAAANRAILSLMLLGHQDNTFFSVTTWIALKIFSTFAGITIFFLIYWILPNGKVRPRSVLPVAIVMGVLWEVSKYIYIKMLPKLDFREVYGPFSISVALMFWAFLSGLLLLAGAHLASDFATRNAKSSL